METVTVSRYQLFQGLPWVVRMHGVTGHGLRFWSGVIMGIMMVVPARAEPPVVIDPAAPPAVLEPGRNDPVKGGRVGLFEAMAVGVRAGLRERMDRSLQALTAFSPADTSPARLRDWIETAGWGGRTVAGQGGDRPGDFDPSLVWNLVALALEKEGAPREQGGGEPSSSLVRTVALAIVTDVRDAYWRSATTDLLLHELDKLLEEANASLVRMRTPDGTLASADAQSLQSQNMLLATTEKLWKWRQLLIAAKERLVGLLALSGGQEAVRIGVAATEMHDPGILSLPVTFMEEQALTQWAMRNNLPREHWMGARQVERALMAAFPGYAFPGLGHETMSMAPAGAPSWVEAGMALAGQLAQGTRPTASDQADDGKVVRLAQGVGTLIQLHLALMECRMTEKRLNDIREQNKAGQTSATSGAARNGQGDLLSAEIARKADALIVRLLQGLAFADNQVALGRLLIALGRDPIPPMPGLERLAPPTLTANIAFRHESATTALLSAMNNGSEPDVDEQLKVMSGSAATADKGGMWQRMSDFSQNKGLSSPRTERPKEVPRTFNRDRSDGIEPVEGERVPISAE